jgi:DNA replicative helicase MCM subunit Mcm2 (Cdc46/Mcm family)
MVFACKKCKKCFRKDTREWDADADSFCPHCDNLFVLDAVTQDKKKNAKLVLELEQSHGVRRKIELSADELAELEGIM